MQYKKAKELGLAARADEKEIALNEVYLDNHGDAFEFTARCLAGGDCDDDPPGSGVYSAAAQGLRDPAAFAGASLKFWRREELARGMLAWSGATIPTSLTTLPRRLVMDAVRLHKCVLGFCGDRRNPTPNVLAHEVVTKCCGEPRLGVEIYCQLMKHAACPDAESHAQGFALLALCCAHFAPGARLSPFVHMFLRRHRRKRLTRALYATEYRERNEGRTGAHGVAGPDRLLDTVRELL